MHPESFSRKVKFYVTNKDVWASAKPDLYSMLDGWSCDIRKEYYPDWSDRDIKDLIHAVDGKLESRYRENIVIEMDSITHTGKKCYIHKLGNAYLGGAYIRTISLPEATVFATKTIATHVLREAIEQARSEGEHDLADRLAKANLVNIEQARQNLTPIFSQNRESA